MGKPVTVDSDDLDMMLMHIGTIKQVEQLITQRNGDPFVPKDALLLCHAHNRLAIECRRVTRELHPDHDKPITAKAYALLKNLSGKVCHIDQATMKLPLYKELALRLFIEYGNCYEVVYWSNTQEQQNLNAVAAVLVRVTPRGKTMLEEMSTKDQSQIQ